MKDFTIKAYKDLLDSLIEQRYVFLPFNTFITNIHPKAVCLRHDVDLLPYNSLEFATIQTQHNIKGTYYFRDKRFEQRKDS